MGLSTRETPFNDDNCDPISQYHIHNNIFDTVETLIKIAAIDSIYDSGAIRHSDPTALHSLVTNIIISDEFGKLLEYLRK